MECFWNYFGCSNGSESVCEPSSAYQAEKQGEYTLDDDYAMPAAIFDGNCYIDFAEIYQEIRFLYNT